jgi:hypothetical protein
MFVFLRVCVRISRSLSLYWRIINACINIKLDALALDVNQAFFLHIRLVLFDIVIAVGSPRH